MKWAFSPAFHSPYKLEAREDKQRERVWVLPVLLAWHLLIYSQLPLARGLVKKMNVLQGFTENAH